MKREEVYAEGLGCMIQCKTISKRGSFEASEFQKLRSAVKRLFPTVHKKTSLKIFGDDCWLYYLPGKNHDRRIALMAHHDVVEAKGDWKHDPFSSEVHDGAIWGRGTVDTKGALFAELEAMEELLKDGFTPECDVYLASSCNEEIAGDGIPLVVKYFMDHGMRFDLVLDEGGAVLEPPLPGISKRCAMIAVHEKGFCNITCSTAESAGHPSLSADKNPVVSMSKFISEVSKNPPFKKKLYPSVRAMFESLAPYMSAPYKSIFSNLDVFGWTLVNMMPKMSPQAAAMVGTACNFKEIETHTNEDGTKICKTCATLKFVDEDDLEADIQTLKKLASVYGVIIDAAKDKNYEFHKPADLNGLGLKFIKRVTSENFPDVAVAPMLLPTGTDARHFSEICDNVMRFAPINISKEQYASVHNVNENLDISCLPVMVDFYKQVLTEWE